VGLIGILAGLGLLIWLAFRGWSVLLLAPPAAMVAAAAAREPLRSFSSCACGST
jgi:hypothetical protein